MRSLLNSLYLSWCYVRANLGKSAILVASLTLAVSLPLTAWLMIAQLEDGLTQRARDIPVVVGADGSRFDLVLGALYLEPRRLEPVDYGEYLKIREDAEAAVPLHLAFTARGFPVVGTTLDYFEARGLAPVRGNVFALLGEAVVGAEVARELDLGPGDELPTDPENLYDLAGRVPLVLRVAGVLPETDSPDDRGVFVDVKTTWVLEGIGHGHEELAEAADEYVLQRSEGRIAANAALPEHQRITPENLAAFHFHGDPDEYPLSAILLFPPNERERALLLGRFTDPAMPVQALRAELVVGEILDRVLKVKRIFDAAMVVVWLAVLLFLALIFALSLRLRQREMRTLFKIGASRGFSALLQCGELLILIAVSLLFSAILFALINAFGNDFALSLLR